VLLPTVANACLCSKLLCTRICLPHHATTATTVPRDAIYRHQSRYAAVCAIAAVAGAALACHPSACGLVAGRRRAALAHLESVVQSSLSASTKLMHGNNTSCSGISCTCVAVAHVL
jgi:hypothetical protein